MPVQSKISLYVDTLIIDSFISEPSLIKNASAAEFVSAVKNYFGDHIDQSDPEKTFLNAIAPGAILVALSTLGFPKIGFLLGLATSVFKINIEGILSNIYESIKSLISSGNQATSAQVDQIVDQAVSEGTKDSVSEEDAKKAYLHRSDFSLSDDGFLKEKSVKAQLRDVRMLKLALISYESSLQKTALNMTDILSWFSLRQAGSTTLLRRLLSTFLKVGLASAGLMVITDIIYTIIGKKNPLADAIHTKPQTEAPGAPKSVPLSYRPSQTKFKVSPSYSEENKVRWFENYTNNQIGIENMILDFAEDVYPDLVGKENLIRSSKKFNDVVDFIMFYNREHAGQSLIAIPTQRFPSKKSIVDAFIDEVAKLDTSMPSKPTQISV